MKKIILFFTFLSLGVFSFGCSKDKNEINWNPPIKGLMWGMSMDEVKKVLNFKTYETSDQDKTTEMMIDEKCNTIYGIDMVFKLTFDKNMGLFKFEGVCDDSNIPDLKEKLEEKYGTYLSRQQPSHGIRWDSEKVIDREDYEEIMDLLFDRFGSQPEYDSLKEGFKYSPLVYVELIETGKRIGTLIVNGDKQVDVDTLLND
ncbi:MAG: hypothetical protein EWM47_08350 [Anaerolineaceae bacterium]|nr:MAG: hypothetical protein EWM47_08350 [Anaerolineaceae bacterium]